MIETLRQLDKDYERMLANNDSVLKDEVPEGSSAEKPK